MDPQTQATEDAEAIWPTISTTISSARTAARSITLDTQRAASDGRFLSLESRFDSVGTRLLDLEKKALDERAVEGVADELVTQFLDLRATVSDTASQFDALVASVVASDKERTTSLTQTIDGFDSRVGGVEDTRQEQGEELREMMSYLEQAFSSVDELSGRIDQAVSDNSGTVEHIQSLIAQIETKLLDTAGEIATVTSLIEERAAEAGEQVAVVRSRADQLDRRADEVVTKTEQLDSRIDSALARSDQLDQRIDGSIARGEQIDARVGEAIALSDEIVTELATRGSALDERISDVSARADNTDLRIEEVNSRLAQADMRIDDAANRVDESEDRVGQLQEQASRQTSEAIDHVNTRVDEITRTAHENGAEVQEQIDALTHVVQEERTQLVARLDDLVQDDTDGATRIDSLEQRLDETARAARDAAEQTSELRSETDRRIESRLTDAEQHATDRIAEAREQLATNLQATERHLNDRSDEIWLALDDRSASIDANREQIDARVAAIERCAEESADQQDQLVSDANDASAELMRETEARLNRVEGSVGDRFGEMTTAIDEKLHSINDRTTSQVRDLESGLIEQLGETRDLLDQRIATVEAAVSSDRVEDFTTAVQNAASESRKAQELSESLRVLQTDLVRALEHELSLHAERLGTVETEFATAQSDRHQFVEIRQNLANAEARIEHAEATIVSLASREPNTLDSPAVDNSRLELLESRFYEAAQVIEKLSEFQQHNASVDSVNQSLASMAGGVDRAAAEVDSLREQLDIALTRIAHLEENVDASPTGNTAVDTRAEESAAVEQPPNLMFNRPGDDAAGEPPAEVVERSAASQAASEELDSLYGLSPDHEAAVEHSADAAGNADTDSNWFAESYAKKSKQKGRFRRG